MPGTCVLCDQKYKRPVDRVKRTHRTPMFDFLLNVTAPNYIKGDYSTIREKKFTGTALSHVRSKHEGKAVKEFVNGGLLK